MAAVPCVSCPIKYPGQTVNPGKMGKAPNKYCYRVNCEAAGVAAGHIKKRGAEALGAVPARAVSPQQMEREEVPQGRYVSYINRLSRGMRWFKPEKAPDRSVRSARVSRCSLRAADGARGEAWRPLTVSHGVSETGTIEYHHRVIHPGRGGS